MKCINVEVHLFEKGDRVFTPEGQATVVEDEVWNEDDREVKVVLDEPISGHPCKGEEWMIDRIACCLGEL
mgnify:CR=1 FL=1